MNGIVSESIITPLNIINSQTKGKRLKREDVIVEWRQLNYAFKDKNPVDSIRFFSKRNLDISCTISKEEVSGFIPHHYSEITVRIFSRDADKCREIQFAFRSFLAQLNSKLEIDGADSGILMAESESNGIILSPPKPYLAGPILDESNNIFLVSPTSSRNNRLIASDVLKLDEPSRQTLNISRKYESDQESEGIECVECYRTKRKKKAKTGDSRNVEGCDGFCECNSGSD